MCKTYFQVPTVFCSGQEFEWTIACSWVGRWCILVLVWYKMETDIETSVFSQNNLPLPKSNFWPKVPKYDHIPSCMSPWNIVSTWSVNLLYLCCFLSVNLKVKVFFKNKHISDFFFPQGLELGWNRLALKWIRDEIGSQPLCFPAHFNSLSAYKTFK